MWVSGRTRARRIRHAWSCWAGFGTKRIFLFGTAGFGGSEAYYQKILANVRTAIDASNTVVGEYMCQGRMPQAVRDRYVKMKEMPDAKPNLDALIENFDQALSHPDQEDLERLRRMITG